MPYSSIEEEDIILWIREVKIAHNSGMIRTEHQRVAMVINKLDGRAKKLALTCSVSIYGTFPT